MCRPFAKNWNPELKGHCGASIPAYICIAALDIFGDLMIITLPMPMIWRLHTSTSNKIGLSLIFALGILSVMNQAQYLTRSTDLIHSVGISLLESFV